MIARLRTLALVAGFGLCAISRPDSAVSANDRFTGFSFSRIFGFAGLTVSQGAQFLFAAPAGLPSANGYGAVSGTVFGVDFQVPIAAAGIARTSSPARFSDRASVAGLRLKVDGVAGSVRYKPLGKNVLSGVQFRSFGPAPTSFAFVQNAFFPRFFGFAGLTIEQSFDGAPGTLTASNENAHPHSVTTNVRVPLRVARTQIDANLLPQHVQERRITGFGQAAFNGNPVSSRQVRWDKVGGGVTFPVPVFGKKVSLNVSAAIERPHQSTAQAFADPPVLYFPNYIDVFHQTFGAGASLPINRNVVFVASYNSQGFHGSYGTTTGQSIAERKDEYQGVVTYTIPRTQSSVSVLFRNEQYRDSALPTYNVNTNREDLNFTVRF